MSLISYVESLGAGWWVEWRNAEVAKAKAAFNAALDALEPAAKQALVTAEQAGIAAAKTSIEAGGTVSADAVAVRNAVETSISTQGVQIAEEAAVNAIPAIVAAVTATPAATPAPAP